jgi:hypothetical protein
MAEKINFNQIEGETSSLQSVQLETQPRASGCRLARHAQGWGLKRKTRKARRGVFCLVVRPHALWLFLIYLVAMVSGASAQTRGKVPTLETIIARMGQARVENRAHFRPYTVTRDYKLFDKERDKTKSQVISDVIFVPPDLKDYPSNGLTARVGCRRLSKPQPLSGYSAHTRWFRET